MGGWSGGVYTRFRNWVTDKANSVNPQASLFDQEDDGFAAGLNNCVTKDGLSKPSAQMDFNGQNLIGVLALTASSVNVTGAAVPLNGCYLSAANTLALSSAGTLRATINSQGNWSVVAPSAGIAVTINGFNSNEALVLNGSSTVSGSFGATIKAGTNSADYGLLIANQANTLNFFKVRGDGLVQAADEGNTLQTVGWRDLPQTASAVSYQLIMADRGKSVVLTGGSTITIPANATVGFPIGTTIALVNFAGGGALNVAITTDTLTLAGTTTTGTRSLAQNGIATIVKVNATNWIISGSGLS